MSAKIIFLPYLITQNPQKSYLAEFVIYLCNFYLSVLLIRVQ